MRLNSLLEDSHDYSVAVETTLVHTLSIKHEYTKVYNIIR